MSVLDRGTTKGADGRGTARPSSALSASRGCFDELLEGFAVLREVEAFDLVLLAYPQRHEEFDDFEQHVGQHAAPNDGDDDCIELNEHLTRIALDQSRHACGRVGARGE